MSLTSTRLVSLQRPALALLLWAEFAAPLRLVHHLQGPGLVPSLLFYVTSPLMLLGVCSRTSSALTGALALWSWVVLAPARPVPLGDSPLGDSAAGLLCWSALWLSFTPCGGSLSWDRWRAVRRAHRLGEPVPAEQGEGQGLWLLQLQLTVMLVLRALDRSTVDYLSGEALRRAADGLGLDGPVPGGLGTSLSSPLGTVVALLTFAVGWILPVALWLPATRLAAVAIVCLGGLVVYPILPVGVESLVVCVLACSFLDPEHVHRSLDRLLGR